MNNLNPIYKIKVEFVKKVVFCIDFLSIFVYIYNKKNLKLYERNIWNSFEVNRCLFFLFQVNFTRA